MITTSLTVMLPFKIQGVYSLRKINLNVVSIKWLHILHVVEEPRMSDNKILNEMKCKETQALLF